MNTRSLRWKEISTAGSYALVRILVVTAVLSGCATNHSIMPVPLLYAGLQARPLFIDLPLENRTPSLDLLFITDRASAKMAGTEELAAAFPNNKAKASEFGRAARDPAVGQIQKPRDPMVGGSTT